MAPYKYEWSSRNAIDFPMAFLCQLCSDVFVNNEVGAGGEGGLRWSGQPGAPRGRARISVLYLVDPRHPTHHHGTGCVEYEKNHPWYKLVTNEGATTAGQSDF